MDINPYSVDDAGRIALGGRVLIDPARLREDPRYTRLAIHPYPEQLVHHTTLRDGSELTVRPIQPEDAEPERRFVERLSI